MKHLVRRISGFAATFALAGLAAGCGMGMEEPEELGEISQESVSKLARGYYTGPDAEIKLEDNDELASTVFTITRRFEPGTVTSWHIHPGMAVGTVVEGSLLLETETHCQTYVAGETFVQGPDVALRNSNPSDTEEALLLVNLFQKDGDPPSLPASVENPACSE